MEYIVFLFTNKKIEYFFKVKYSFFRKLDKNCFGKTVLFLLAIHTASCLCYFIRIGVWENLGSVCNGQMRNCLWDFQIWFCNSIMIESPQLIRSIFWTKVINFPVIWHQKPIKQNHRKIYVKLVNLFISSLYTFSLTISICQILTDIQC